MAKKLLAFYAVWHWLRLEASRCLTTRVLDVSPRLCLTIRRLYSKYQQERFVLRKSVKISMQERLCWLNIMIEGSELSGECFCLFSELVPSRKTIDRKFVKSTYSRLHHGQWKVERWKFKERRCVTNTLAATVVFTESCFLALQPSAQRSTWRLI